MIRNLGQYTIEEEFHGGTAIVYRAVDRSLGRCVALKLPSGARGQAPGEVDALLKEARLLCSLDHPNVAKLLHLHPPGELAKDPILVSDWIDLTLKDAIDKDYLSPQQRVHVLKGVCEGLAYIHSKGVLHRDVKPSNIFLSNDVSIVRVGDLGIASLVSEHVTSASMFSHKYMAPEGFDARIEYGPAADIYSLGMTLYELLLGKSKFEQVTRRFFSDGDGRDAQLKWMAWHLDGSRKMPSLHEIDASIDLRLSQIVGKTLEKSVSERYSSMEEVKAALESMGMHGEQSAPDVDALKKKLIKKKNRKRMLIVAAVVSIAATFALIVAVVAERAKSRELREQLDSALAQAIAARDNVLALGGTGASSPEYAAGIQSMAEAKAAFADGELEMSIESARRALASFDRASADTVASFGADTKQATLTGPQADLSLLRMVDALPGSSPGGVSSESLVSLSPRRFLAGSTEAEISRARTMCGTQECPAGVFDGEEAIEVMLAPFELDSHEVSVADFERFVNATSYVTDAERAGGAYQYSDGKLVFVHGGNWRNAVNRGDVLSESAVVGVSWNDASRYCQWAGGRLPSAWEWEFVARGPERKMFIGGDAPPVTAGLVITGPVTSGLAQGIGGAYRNLGGGVWEWVDGKTKDGARILKGASALEKSEVNLRLASFRVQKEDHADGDSGIRCARTVEKWPDASYWLAKSGSEK